MTDRQIARKAFGDVWLGATIAALLLIGVGFAACELAPNPPAQPGPACVSPGTSPPPSARPGFSPRYCTP